MRWWNETAADLFDAVSLPLLVFLLLAGATAIALLWYFWPDWLPWRWRIWQRRRDRSDQDKGSRWRFRLGRFRWRWRLHWRLRRRKRGQPESTPDLAPDELPDLPAEVLALTADDLAAQGRYAEAVRERLRAIVRELIERGIIPHTPGWTVTELAAAASRQRPGLAPPLGGAATVFSEIWYGLRPATATDDAAMREHAGAVRSIVAEPAAVAGGGS
jgi:hypothetical protein